MPLLASAYDQSRFFKAADLKGEKKFRIKNVTEELVGTEGQKEKKLVVWFTNDERGLVLNKTNNRAIRSAYGDDTADWVGKIIVVFPTMVDVRGKMTPALRVRIPPPKQAAAAAPSPEAVQSGNGAAAVAPTQKLMAAAPPVDPELEDDPVKPLADELNDEINF
jgi:hypothetical protein